MMVTVQCLSNRFKSKDSPRYAKTCIIATEIYKQLYCVLMASINVKIFGVDLTYKMLPIGIIGCKSNKMSITL